MAYSAETELVLTTLYKERKELSEKLAELDKLIKRIKFGSVNLGGNKGLVSDENTNTHDTTQLQQAFPIKADLKVQAIKIMDILGKASKLCEIRDKYKEITGITCNFRETLRNLNKHNILKLLQPKNSIRGLYWIKEEWLDEHGQLREKHKFEGYELLFSDEMVEYK